MYVKTADLAQRQLLNVLSFIIYSPSYNLNYNGVQILPHNIMSLLQSTVNGLFLLHNMLSTLCKYNS